MKHEKEAAISEKIKTISVGVSLLITLAGVAISIINYFTLNQLSPLVHRIGAVEASQENMATKQQLESVSKMVDGRLKSLEEKIEYIYRVHINR